MANCGEDGMADCGTTANREAAPLFRWDQAAYMRDQCCEIARHKWIESERAGCDLGDKAVFDWISRYAGLFRRYAEESGRYRT